MWGFVPEMMVTYYGGHIIGKLLLVICIYIYHVYSLISVIGHIIYDIYDIYIYIYV